MFFILTLHSHIFEYRSCGTVPVAAGWQCPPSSPWQRGEAVQTVADVPIQNTKDTIYTLSLHASVRIQVLIYLIELMLNSSCPDL